MKQMIVFITGSTLTEKKNWSQKNTFSAVLLFIKKKNKFSNIVFYFFRSDVQEVV